MIRFRRSVSKDAGVAHPVERHLAKVEVASSSLVTRSKQIRNAAPRSLFHMVPWPSGKAKVCKTFIPQFKSGRYLQKKNSIRKDAVFCQRNPSLRTGEMPLRGVKLLRSEILLRRVKDGFHFTFRKAEYFTIRRMISHCGAIFHFAFSFRMLQKEQWEAVYSALNRQRPNR